MFDRCEGLGVREGCNVVLELTQLVDNVVREEVGEMLPPAQCGLGMGAPGFEIGQQFEVTGETPWAMPEGFCGWAWADIQKLVYGLARGGQPKFVTCCTDGYRPVIFLLERIDGG